MNAQLTFFSQMRSPVAAVVKAGLLAVTCLLSLQVSAATQVVTSTMDSGAGSLRQVLAEASSGDTITFAVSGTITLTNGELVVNKSLSIAGPGAATLAISGNQSSRVFWVGGSTTVVLSGLTIRQGKAADGTNGTGSPYPNPPTPGGPGADGGAIYSSGTLTLRDCVISGSAAGKGGDGTESGMSPSAGGDGGAGGAIYSLGSLTLSNCWVQGNSAGDGGVSGHFTYSPVSGRGGAGGGIYSAGLLVMHNTVVSGNGAGKGGDTPVEARGATGGAGGGVWSGSDCVANSCTFSNNSAGRGGHGGVDTSFAGSGGAGGSGGGVYCMGSLTLTNCTVNQNLGGPGGDGGNGGGSGFGAGGPGGDGGSGGGIYAATSFAAHGCTLRGNLCGSGGAGGSSYNGPGNVTYAPPGAEGNGGGLWGATNGLSYGCSFAGNRAGIGGGVFGGKLKQCQLTSNTAVNGGGAASGALTNCLVTGNTASAGAAAWESTVVNSAITQNSGDGATSCVLFNCTITGNSGRGISTSTLNNCISYYNSGNHDPASLLNYCCTTPLPAAGTGNFSDEPLLASAFYLSATSPCRATGSAVIATGLDLEGEPWATPPAVGCDEYYSGSATGVLGVTITADLTNVAMSLPVKISGAIAGHADGCSWDFGDGTVVSNRPFVVPYSWAAPGVYAVVLRAYNESNPGGVSASVVIQVNPAIHYVRADSTTPVVPYSSWETAAANIQDAIDLAATGALVLVSNGMYATGGSAVHGLMTNRVVIPSGVTVESVNGPQSTIIEGYQIPGSTNGDGAIRCAYVAAGATLSGFTLRHGATRTTSDYSEQCAGGVWCESDSAVVSNCFIMMNAANDSAGGVYSGTLTRCWLTENSASWSGGGSVYSTLNNCLVTSNTAAQSGGGAYGGPLFNCTVVGNSAGSTGGGTYAEGTGGALRNCIIYSNAAPVAANYSVYENTPPLVNCCTTPMPLGTGNISSVPQFVDYGNGNFRLQSNSPCINVGDNSYAPGGPDLDGRTRVVGTVIDIGAYEYQGTGMGEYLGWVQQYGLPTEESIDSADTDADGLNTWQEWRCRTCPTNAVSALRLLSSLPSGGDVTVNWQSVAGVNYSLERSTNLASAPGFHVIATNLPGQPIATTFTDTNASGLSPLFYRVKVP